MRRWNANSPLAREDDPGESVSQAPDGMPEYSEADGHGSEPDFERTPRRVPNLGHALLLFTFAGMMIVIFALIYFASQ